MDSNPLNLTELLMAALGGPRSLLSAAQEYDSNLPLFFYFVACLQQSHGSRRESYLLYAGLIFALVLRFEFLNQGFARVIAFFTTASLCLTIYVIWPKFLATGNRRSKNSAYFCTGKPAAFHARQPPSSDIAFW